MIRHGLPLLKSFMISFQAAALKGKILCQAVLTIYFLLPKYTK